MSGREVGTNEAAAGYGEYCRPKLVRLLQAFTLDAVYERAEGHSLFRRDGDRLIEVLDLVGGFGAAFFGHNHPDLVAEAIRALTARVPIHAQGSCRTGAARLAEALRARLGDYIVLLTNSGTETVEAALKHAHLERPQPICWAVTGAFHGKTLGSIQLTEHYRSPYAAWGPQVHFLDPDDPATWEAAAADAERTCAAVVEPIRGEGGVRPLPRPFVDWLNTICAATGIPLIADEIQTGIGRTGTFVASGAAGLRPDYICLSKALGGGLAKIGALLIARDRFVDEFSVAHTSTFAEDELSCAIALKALEVLDRDDLMARCAAAGRTLMARLEALRARYPDQIKEIRGRGLLVGIEFHDARASRSNVLRMLSAQDYLGYMIAAYLLNVHAIRVAPTLSDPLTIRVEPPASITEAEIDRFADALALCCEALAAADAGHLTSFQVGHPTPPIEPPVAPRPYKRDPARTERRVAFLGHLIDPEHAGLWDPSLMRLDTAERERYMAKPSRVLDPALFDSMHVHSATGDVVHLSYIGMDLTPRQAIDAIRTQDTAWIMQKIEAAVVLAREAGCQVLGLGGYTSIVSGNCCRITGRGIALTSGNALTVGMGALALQDAATRAGIDPRTSRVAVVGATGNIGQAYAQVLAPIAGELVLVVRDAGSPRARMVRDAVTRSSPDTPVRVVDDPAALGDCALIVAASNEPSAVIHPRHLGEGTVIVADISLPSDVAETVARERPRAVIIHGGIVRLPLDDDFTIAGLPLDPGHAYACLAETLLLGLDGAGDTRPAGAITLDQIDRAMGLARKHGFALGEYASAPAF